MHFESMRKGKQQKRSESTISDYSHKAIVGCAIHAEFVPAVAASPLAHTPESPFGLSRGTLAVTAADSETSAAASSALLLSTRNSRLLLVNIENELSNTRYSVPGSCKQSSKESNSWKLLTCKRETHFDFKHAARSLLVAVVALVGQHFLLSARTCAIASQPIAKRESNMPAGVNEAANARSLSLVRNSHAIIEP